MNGTALPAWLLQILPQWFLDRPAFTEATFASFMVLLRGAGTILWALWAAYTVIVPDAKDQNLDGYLVLVKGSWFSAAVPIIWAYFNGKNAHTKAAAAAQQNGIHP